MTGVLTCNMVIQPINLQLYYYRSFHQWLLGFPMRPISSLMVSRGWSDLVGEAGTTECQSQSGTITLD